MITPVSKAEIDTVGRAAFSAGPEYNTPYAAMVTELLALRVVADAAERVHEATGYGATSEAHDDLGAALRDAGRLL